EWTHVVAEMPTGGVDLSRVDSVHFYQDRNPTEFTIVLDGVRLIPKFRVEAGHLREAIDRAGALAREQGVLDRLEAELSSLEAASVALEAAAVRTSPDTDEAVGIEERATKLRIEADTLALRITKERAAMLTGLSDPDYVLVAESSMVNIMPDGAPFEGRPGKPVEIAVAGGEVEAGQIIIAPLSKGLRDVEFGVSQLAGPRGATLTAELSAMGYVYTDPDVPPSYPVDRLGWFPDPILPFVESFDVDRDKVQSLWLSVTCPRGQRAGVYRGAVTVAPANAPEQSIPVNVRVFGFDVPKERSLMTAICTFEYQLPRVHGDAWNDEMYWKYVDFLHEHRMNMDRIYRGHEDAPTLEDVKRMLAGGQDAWCLRYIVQPGEGGSGTGVDPTTFDEYVTQAIEDSEAAYEVFKEAGAEDICYIYFFDEVGVQHYDMLKAAAARVREALPGVPLMTTARDADYGIRSGVSEAIDIWVPLTPGFNTDQGTENIAKARANGDEVWWYICIGPRRPYANMFIEYDAIEPRLLMGAMTQKYQPEGFLYYATTMWGPNDHPITEG
ncbi:MAG TPA: DUF6067 family protein, partial [Armatimonadota bacterium]|nr:DUF6067 family protein [Armatimonadota bacterium]